MAVLKISSESRDCRKRAKRDGTAPGFRTVSFSSFTGEAESLMMNCPEVFADMVHKTKVMWDGSRRP